MRKGPCNFDMNVQPVKNSVCFFLRVYCSLFFLTVQNLSAVLSWSRLLLCGIHIFRSAVDIILHTLVSLRYNSPVIRVQRRKIAVISCMLLVWSLLFSLFAMMTNIFFLFLQLGWFPVHYPSTWLRVLNRKCWDMCHVLTCNIE